MGHPLHGMEATWILKRGIALHEKECGGEKPFILNKHGRERLNKRERVVKLTHSEMIIIYIPNPMYGKQISVIVAILGFIAGNYKETQTQIFGLVSTSSIPYSDFMVPLLVGGIILIIVGLVLNDK
jgi:hypothetical protein